MDKYDKEISAIGAVLKLLSDLTQDERIRVLNYAHQWRKDNEKENTNTDS